MLVWSCNIGMCCLCFCVVPTDAVKQRHVRSIENRLPWTTMALRPTVSVKATWTSTDLLPLTILSTVLCLGHNQREQPQLTLALKSSRPRSRLPAATRCLTSRKKTRTPPIKNFSWTRILYLHPMKQTLNLDLTVARKSAWTTVRWLGCTWWRCHFVSLCVTLCPFVSLCVTLPGCKTFAWSSETTDL